MKKLLIALAVFFAVAGSAAAQTLITTTTLSLAMTGQGLGAQNITVGSATGMAVNGTLYIDGSVYKITAISGTTITVITTAFPATHLTSATVYVVPAGAIVGHNPVGSCLRGTAGPYPFYSPYALMFNTSTGDVAACRQAPSAATTNTWVITNPYANGAASNNPPQTR